MCTWKSFYQEIQVIILKYLHFRHEFWYLYWRCLLVVYNWIITICAAYFISFNSNNLATVFLKKKNTGKESQRKSFTNYFVIHIGLLGFNVLHGLKNQTDSCLRRPISPELAEMQMWHLLFQKPKKWEIDNGLHHLCANWCRIVDRQVADREIPTNKHTWKT